MQKDLIWRNISMWTGIELWVVIWKLYVNGTLYAGDFEEGTGEETPAESAPAEEETE